MEQYQWVSSNSIRWLHDGLETFIPKAPGNLEYDEMLAKIEAGTAELLPEAPEPEPHWKDKRQANIADGGYGTIREQLEMIGEGGASTVASYQTHIAAVKARFAKA